MSAHAAPVVTPADLLTGHRAAAADEVHPRVWIRAVSFTLLVLYGVDRWGRLMSHPPQWRLLGLGAAAIALGFGVPLVRGLGTRRLPGAGRILAGLLTVGLVLAAFPISGLRWHWVVHLKLAVSARAVGTGLGALADVLVPYLGHASAVRLVIVLGAALLLLDAGAVLAFAGPPGSSGSSGQPGPSRWSLSDGRRAAAALPLIALAVVPSTLVRPAHPALQGLLLFALLALFVWGERIGRDGVAAAVGVACVAGVVGVLLGPRIEGHHPWVDYRAWAGASTVSTLDSFDWNQNYGPLRWPQDGHEVLTVRARSGDYWKAEDLQQFNGTDWVQGSPGATAALPSPSRSALRRWTQIDQITIDGMRTEDVIAGSGLTVSLFGVPGGERPGATPGTWVTDRPLGPGSTYIVRTYSPAPSPRQLSGAGRRYPWAALAPDLTLTLPGDEDPAAVPVVFPRFHAPPSATVRRALRGSPYAPVDAVARRLAASAASPEAFVVAVKRYLDGGAYTYDQNPRSARYPLVDFLLHTKQGYCQQFSGAMALLLRMGGIPARVAAGFTPGAFDHVDHTWTVSDIDAHAWVEVWFPRYGWVKFDPTPTSAPARGGTGTAATAKQLPAINPALSRAQRSHVATTSTTRTVVAHAAGGGGGSAGGPDPWPWVGGGLALVAAALGAGTGWRAWRHRTGGDPLAELERALARTGRPLAGGVTLTALEHRFRSSPEASAYIRALRLGRYGTAPAPPTAVGRRALRAQLRVGLGAGGWLRALWALPPRPPTPRRAGPGGARPGP